MVLPTSMDNKVIVAKLRNIFILLVRHSATESLSWKTLPMIALKVEALMVEVT